VGSDTTWVERLRVDSLVSIVRPGLSHGSGKAIGPSENTYSCPSADFLGMFFLLSLAIRVILFCGGEIHASTSAWPDPISQRHCNLCYFRRIDDFCKLRSIFSTL
jgi:hypothetical protein